jgi:hypothetical protein
MKMERRELDEGESGLTPGASKHFEGVKNLY